MKAPLAEWLLAKVMNWTPKDVANERPDLQALATFKYDEYHQFSPGMRFIESLALWLDQFGSDDERRQAYGFIRSRLIFISHAEMAHLVAVAFPDFIRPLLIHQTAASLGVSERLVTKIVISKEYKVLQRQSLFLGLSDGARIDLFRRSNPEEVSNEQVFQTYEISTDKAKDLHSKLESGLKAVLGRNPTPSEKKFRMIFLLDDFSGSGLSYLRKESNGPNGLKYAGKIHKIFGSISGANGPLNSLVNLNDLHICLLLYVATEKARAHLDNLIKEWRRDNNISSYCSLMSIQPLPDAVKLQPGKDRQVIDLLKKYFDSSIINEHYRKGLCDEPHLGFDQCALPLILSHNTPNNSLPLLWFEEGRDYRGLFPRVNRHKSEL